MLKELLLSQGCDVREQLARIYALKVVDLWQAPAVMVDFLMTGREELREPARKETLKVTWPGKLSSPSRRAALGVVRGSETWEVAMWARRAMSREASGTVFAAFSSIDVTRSVVVEIARYARCAVLEAEESWQIVKAKQLIREEAKKQ